MGARKYDIYSVYSVYFYYRYFRIFSQNTVANSTFPKLLLFGSFWCHWFLLLIDENTNQKNVIVIVFSGAFWNYFFQNKLFQTYLCLKWQNLAFNIVDVRKSCLRPTSYLKNNTFLLKMANILLTMAAFLLKMVNFCLIWWKFP